MAVNRRASIMAKLFENGSTELSMARLCEVCTEVTGTTGAGVMLMSGDLPYGSLCTTNDVSARIEDLQYTLGEGPCVAASPAGSRSRSLRLLPGSERSLDFRSAPVPLASARSTSTAPSRGPWMTSNTTTRWPSLT